MASVHRGGLSQRQRGKCPVKASIPTQRQGLGEHTKGLGTLAVVSVPRLPPTVGPRVPAEIGVPHVQFTSLDQQWKRLHPATRLNPRFACNSMHDYTAYNSFHHTECGLSEHLNGATRSIMNIFKMKGIHRTLLACVGTSNFWSPSEARISQPQETQTPARGGWASPGMTCVYGGASREGRQ